MVCVDNHSKWVLTKLTESSTAAEVAKFIEDIIETDGVPKEVRTDDATVIKSDKISCFVNQNPDRAYLFNTVCTHTNRNGEEEY